MTDQDRPEEGIGTLFGRLAEDGKEFARAEVAYYRALANDKVGPLKSGLIFGVAALVIAWSALTALLVGLILTLATLMGPGLATLLVVLVALALAGLLGWMAWSHLRRLGGED